jgi:hypothetical protein
MGVIWEGMGMKRMAFQLFKFEQRRKKKQRRKSRTMMENGGK